MAVVRVFGKTRHDKKGDLPNEKAIYIHSSDRSCGSFPDGCSDGRQEGAEYLDLKRYGDELEHQESAQEEDQEERHKHEFDGIEFHLDVDQHFAPEVSTPPLSLGAHRLCRLRYSAGPGSRSAEPGSFFKNRFTFCS
jgi:hypothetical protein